MSDPTLPAFNNVSSVFLGNPTYTANNKTYKAEPSGLTIYSDGGSQYLFMVSDNGIIARTTLGSGSAPTGVVRWTINPTPDDSDKQYDYESVTFARGNVMVGVEGDRNGSVPKILRFDQNNTSTSNPAGTFTGSEWDLQGIDFGTKTNSGMEAMTVIPYGSYPSNWTNNASPHYGGLFFVAVQAVYGKIYVYDLPQGSADSHDTLLFSLGSVTNPLTVPTVSSAPRGSQPLISDMFFDSSSSVLYVLYDGGTDSAGTLLENNYLQKLTISTSSTATTILTETWSAQLTGLNREGVAVNGNDLYISVDDGQHPEKNGVFVFPGALADL